MSNIKKNSLCHHEHNFSCDNCYFLEKKAVDLTRELNFALDKLKSCQEQLAVTQDNRSIIAELSKSKQEQLHQLQLENVYLLQEIYKVKNAASELPSKSNSIKPIVTAKVLSSIKLDSGDVVFLLNVKYHDHEWKAVRSYVDFRNLKNDIGNTYDEGTVDNA
jgi:hypothetical protein